MREVKKEFRNSKWDKAKKNQVFQKHKNVKI